MVNYGTNSRTSLQKVKSKNRSKKARAKYFGQLWKAAREKANLTQHQVAEELGYTSGQFISNVESGRCRFPESQLSKLQSLYKLKTPEILKLVLEEEEENLRRALGLNI